MDLASRLKTLREKRSLSQYRLAQQSGVSQSFLSALEAGTKWPTVYTLDKICQCLGISLAEFFTNEPVSVPDYIRSLIEESRYLKPGQCEKLAIFLASFRESNAK